MRVRVCAEFEIKDSSADEDNSTSYKDLKLGYKKRHCVQSQIVW